MLSRALYIAGLAYQIAGLGTAALIIQHRPVAVLVGAAAVALSFLVLRLVWRWARARLRIARRLNWN
jgi:predicted lysophospholipase L1 biosynthesis ABC-type transport system permease subunit